MPEPRSLDDLLALDPDGEKLDYLLFYSHRSPGPGYLSQWWPSPFTLDGVTYRTAEHWMMAAKARLFDDTDTAERITAAEHPKTAKALGRQVRGFDETTWATHRFDLVVTGNLAKFDQHPEMRDYLLGTGEQILVEASPTDQIWGIGLPDDDPRAHRPTQWRGLNLLGFALMTVRAHLANR